MEKKNLTSWYIESVVTVLLILLTISLNILSARLINQIEEVEKSLEIIMDNVVETTPSGIEAPIESEPIENIPETEVEEIVDEPIAYFDVPLDAKLQEHIISLCDEYGIEPSLVIAIIDKESKYNSSVVGDGGRAFGLMQIQPQWHQARMDELDCTDLLDPYQNVTVGIDYLADLFNMSSSTTWVLMAYNGGPGHANSNTANGTVSNYASTVLHMSNSLNN